MVLSTAMPIVIAAIVIVIISRGIPAIPIKPNIDVEAIILGMMPIILNFIEQINNVQDEKEIEKQIELQEKKLAKQQRNLEEQIDLEEKEEIITKKKKEKNLSTINKVAENNEINSKDFDELVENILTRNSTRSYPKINDIPK